MKSNPCHTMSDVRENIDRIDRVLIDILTERQSYILEAARIKQSPSSVRDEKRIQQVIDGVVHQAQEKGLDISFAKNIWHAIIETSINYEMKKWHELHENNQTNMHP